MTQEHNLLEFTNLYGTKDLLRTMEITAPANHEIFINRLNVEIAAIIRQIESGPKERGQDSEDRLTMELVSCLSSAGYIAVKDPTQGGHVDLSVSPRQNQSMRWIGEAKIWRGVTYLMEGMAQLLTRYATGRDPDMGFLVYIKQKNAAGLMTEWGEHVTNHPVCCALNAMPIDAFSFDSQHDHQSGVKVNVRHFGINIYWPHT